MRLHYPAEWERHEATWIGWPHNSADWPGKFGPIPWAFAEMARHIAAGERLHIIVQDARHEAAARRVLRDTGVAEEAVRYFRWPTNRGWTRDLGPLFVRSGSKRARLAILDYTFNAWAKYPDWELDNAVAARAARAMKLPRIDVVHRGRRVVLEGGALDVNGRGTLITTEECLMDQEVQCRNPGFSKRDWAAVFERYFGAKNVLWFGRGIAGDDTHGHVDDLCRFVNPKTVVLVREKNPADENYRSLEENWERVRDMRLEDGSRLEAVALPMPDPLRFRGQRLPASYANFYICNSAVLVPTFNDANDRIALGILAELIPDRPVIGIHAVDLVWGLGAIHCLTREQPTLA
ncbi:MAG: agmatine deiminase family protein [Kiritimatiellae bacterium]|nr:agmatine deiminase family protein [Kiritimatiellia bacterium]MDW8458437.1 agmatine deiminase family protein [Verrucomicrobiota bacterium]